MKGPWQARGSNCLSAYSGTLEPSFHFFLHKVPTRHGPGQVPGYNCRQQRGSGRGGCHC